MIHKHKWLYNELTRNCSICGRWQFQALNLTTLKKPWKNYMPVDYSKLGKRLAFFAVFGVTGIVAIGVWQLIKNNKFISNLQLDGENWWK